MKTYQLTQHFCLNEFTRSATAIANGIDKIRWIFSRRTKCLFHAEFAEFAEKEIPIILRILREIKNILREKRAKRNGDYAHPPACLQRAFAVPPPFGGQPVDNRWTIGGGIKKAFWRISPPGTHPCICFTQNTQNTQRKYSHNFGVFCVR